MASMEQHIRLAQSLPPRLLNFFKKWPPPQIQTSTIPAAAASSSHPETIHIASTTSPTDPNDDTSTPTELSTDPSTSTAIGNSAGRKTNPFLAFKNPTTGNWHSPHYSLRRQADLYKLAKQHNALPLMPLAPKHPEVKEQKRIEHGLRVQGTGVGKRVKGKYWERTLKGRLDERRKAMEGMPEMIRHWKERGHGRGWKKWPK